MRPVPRWSQAPINTTNAPETEIEMPPSEVSEGAPEAQPAAAQEPPSSPAEDGEAQVPLRRSARQRKINQRLIAAFEAEIQKVGNYEAYEVLASWQDETQDLHPLQALAASADPDTMYLHEAMKQPDRKQFIVAMEEEVRAQSDNKNWKIVRKSEVPKDATILPAVWAMKRKRRIDTREVYKWKARLNIDGSKQTKGVNYWETYAPVASWSTIRLILLMAVVKGWETRQIDYVLAYTQADAETEKLYMRVPKGFEIADNDPEDPYVLRIVKNLYGQKQAGRVWNKHLVAQLTSCGFTQSAVDECVFYHGNAIYVLYTDDSILTGPDPGELDTIIQLMQGTGLNLTVEGDICDFLGVNIKKKNNGTIHLTQPHLITQILKDLRLDQDNVAKKTTPAPISKVLGRHSNSPEFDGHFDYRSIVGKLNYLEKSTRPDISYAVHQCARFVADPKKEHGKALMWLGRYLAATRTKGLIFKPKKQSFDCFVDADFSGNWDREETDDTDTARSRTGYVIAYAGCPITWTSKLQTQIALSTTEAEYIALSTATRDVIPLMELLQELQGQGFDYTTTTPTVHCKVFEDNSGAIEIATVHKFRPRTKHINVLYHHFRQYVVQGKISIHAVTSAEQRADVLTKSLPLPLLSKHRLAIQGW